MREKLGLGLDLPGEEAVTAAEFRGRDGWMVVSMFGAFLLLINRDTAVVLVL
jgi:hypothetical protein